VNKAKKIEVEDEAPKAKDDVQVVGRLGGSGTTFQDEVPEITGSLKIVAKNIKTGEKRVVVDEDNVVVENLRSQQVRLMAGNFLPVAPDDITRYIDRIAFGTSGTAETSVDAVITNLVYSTISTVVYPTSASVRFTGTLGAGQGNGITFREAGLMFQAPAPYLAARKTFSPMEKSSLWEWEVNWTLALG